MSEEIIILSITFLCILFFIYVLWIIGNYKPEKDSENEFVNKLSEYDWKKNEDGLWFTQDNSCRTLEEWETL